MLDRYRKERSGAKRCVALVHPVHFGKHRTRLEQGGQDDIAGHFAKHMNEGAWDGMLKLDLQSVQVKSQGQRYICTK